MLKKAMRKKLLEHNWIDIAKSESNLSQTLRRLRDESNRAINDLALLAQKLPDDTLKDIFNYTNISKLINSLLAETKFDGGISALDDIEKTVLASLMARRGIDFCIKLYGQKIETNSVLNESTIAQLNKSIDICDTIAFKMKIPQIHAETQKEGLVRLFNLNKIEEVHETRVAEIKGEDTKKFISFLENERDEAPIAIINKLNLSIYHDNTIEFEFTDIGGYHDNGALVIDVKGKNGSLLLTKNDNGQPKLKRSLIIKIENENLYVYKKKNEVSE
jgi:hypothetical protein